MMNSSQPSPAGAASMTRLPPSPEAVSMPSGAAPGSFSLDDGVDTNMRLRSVARYATFHPQAIACSAPLATSYSNQEGERKVRSESDRKPDEGERRYGSSVAAVAGPHGVALFRVSRPHTPLVVLSHASSKKNATGSISALSFQPHTKDSLLLAAARGNGVLVWDASGHSLSPLLGRLAMEPSLSSSDRITSISWLRTSTQSLLATTNATSACLWDLRTSLRVNPSRPSLRLGTARKVNGDASVDDPLIQIAASNKSQVATLDARGNVHVFDIRMTDRSQGSVGEVSRFLAFHHAGIGLEFLPSRNGDTSWVAWGLDAPQSDAVVKVWSDGVARDAERRASDADSYWFIDGSPQSSPKLRPPLPVDASRSVENHYNQTAEFSTPYLACARISPEPFENKVVTVGMVTGKGQRDGWQAELWELKNTANDTCANGIDYGAEKILSFGVLHDNQTASMIGTNSTLGPLRGAELALEPAKVSRGQMQEGDTELDDEGDGGADLLLCCLTGSGYVTTHMVAEVAPRYSSRRERTMRSEGKGSPRQGISQRGVPIALADTPKVYPNESTGNSVHDPASMVRHLGDSGQAGGMYDSENSFQDTILERRSSGSASPQKAGLQYFTAGIGHLDSNVSRPKDGTTTQFDMDVPVAYGSAAAGPSVGGMDVVEVDSSAMGTPIILLANKDEAIEIGTNVSGRIDKERVPCPRLCGGSFSSGIGGIVCFNNGEVRKMWSWYEQSDPKRRTQAPVLKGRQSSLHHIDPPDLNPKGNLNGDSSSVFKTKTSKQDLPPSRQECPRTLQDLEDMTQHARLAQWRSDESSGGESSVDDQSDESVDESASGDDEDGGAIEISRKRMYETYFGVSQEKSPVTPPRQGGKERTGGSISSPRTPSRQKSASSSVRYLASAAEQAFVGPSSDLVPAVYITHKHDALVLSGQDTELAQGWILGDWYAADEDIEESGFEALDGKEIAESGSKDSGGWSWEDGTLNAWPPAPSDDYQVPLEKEAASALQGSTIRMPQAKSDPMLTQLAPRRPQKKKYGMLQDDDPVHAGAYSVRPDRQESLVFLKKLATHQQRDQQLQTLMSPPDSPMLPNKMPLARGKRSTSSNSLQQTPSPTSVHEIEAGNPNFQAAPLGVYTLAEESAPRLLGEPCEVKIRDACLHNADVCARLGHVEKANVWNLLSQMAENTLEDERDNFNGWGGAYGGALGHDLIGNLLQYYEAQGDVQILATIVCVLSGGQRKKVRGGCSLLPASHEDRYDTYIHRYADVLYGWRLMSIRAEVNKHLVQRLPGADGQYTAVDVAFWCNQCGQEVVTGTGICKKCRNYAFRCSICDIAVRGLFTVCANCGHGGHMEHMTPWFAKHSVCPAGCGCECVLTTSAPEGDPASTQPILDKVLNETPELLITGAGPLPFGGFDLTRAIT